MNTEKWLRSSLRHLSDNLKAQGYAACPNTVGRLLKQMNYALKANVKRQAGTQHPDRNTQFEYIEAQKQYFLSKGWPIISIDVKKKELIGNFKNNGQSWCLEAEHVNDHDFKLDAIGRAVPEYSTYSRYAPTQSTRLRSGALAGNRDPHQRRPPWWRKGHSYTENGHKLRFFTSKNLQFVTVLGIYCAWHRLCHFW